MKKLTTILMAVCMVAFMATSIMAQDSEYADSWTSSTVGSNYDANGQFYSYGDSNAKSYDPVNINQAGSNSAFSYSSQKVESNAYAVGDPFSCKSQNAVAYGESYQFSEAYVNPANGNFAYGGQESLAGYSAEDEGLIGASADGNAKTMGVTYVNSYRSGDGSHANACSTTGSFGTAEANGGIKSTYTAGDGYVEHGSYANKGGAEAGTGGSAAYSYESNGAGQTIGGGFAHTQGTSNVKHHNNGDVTASASSHSFSTGGNTNASGGTHIETNSNNNQQ